MIRGKFAVWIAVICLFSVTVASKVMAKDTHIPYASIIKELQSEYPGKTTRATLYMGSSLGNYINNMRQPGIGTLRNLNVGLSPTKYWGLMGKINKMGSSSSPILTTMHYAIFFQNLRDQVSLTNAIGALFPSPRKIGLQSLVQSATVEGQSTLYGEFVTTSTKLAQVFHSLYRNTFPSTPSTLHVYVYRSGTLYPIKSFSRDPYPFTAPSYVGPKLVVSLAGVALSAFSLGVSQVNYIGRSVQMLNPPVDLGTRTQSLHGTLPGGYWHAMARTEGSVSFPSLAIHYDKDLSLQQCKQMLIVDPLKNRVRDIQFQTYREIYMFSFQDIAGQRLTLSEVSRDNIVDRTTTNAIERIMLRTYSPNSYFDPVFSQSTITRSSRYITREHFSGAEFNSWWNNWNMQQSGFRMQTQPRFTMPRYSPPRTPMYP